jgi:hypothetical protein
MSCLGRLSDDYPWFIREIMPNAKTRMLRFASSNLVCAVLWSKPTTTGTVVCGGRESRSRLTDMASGISAIAGSTMKQTTAI